MLIMFNTRLKIISLFILIGLIIYPTFSDKTLLPGARLDVYVSLVLSILLFFVVIYWEVENVLLQRKAKPKRASNKKKPKENIFYHILMKVLGYIIMCSGFFCCFFLLSNTLLTFYVSIWGQEENYIAEVTYKRKNKSIYSINISSNQYGNERFTSKKVYNSVENGQILQIYKKRTSSLSYIDASEVMKLNALSN